MATFVEIKDSIDQVGQAFEAFKKTNDERLVALKDGNESKAKELDQKLGRIEADIAKYSDLKKTMEQEIALQRDRIEELESRAKSPGKTVLEKKENEYKSTFVDWIRNRGRNANLEQKLESLSQQILLEKKAVTIASSAGGGYAVPEEIARDIERLELKFSPVRRLVKVVKVGTSDYKELVNLRGATSGWVAESGSRTATSTPTLREVVPVQGELYAYPQVSEWALDDIFFNVEAWLAEEIAQRFAVVEGTAVISGTGSSQPKGFLNATPVTTDDFASPMRAAAALEYIPVTGSPIGIAADDLISLVYTLNSQYRSGAAFVMNSLTTAIVRKLKSTQGEYYWQPSLQAGQPDSLMGYPVETWEQMPAATSNLFPIAFGNFRRGYVLVDRVGMRITRDDVTAIGHVKFYVRRREGGIVLNNDAIKLIKFASS